MANREERVGGNQSRRLLNQPGNHNPPKNINLNQRDYDRIMNGGRDAPTQNNQQIMTPRFNPMQSIGELIDPSRMHPQNGMPGPDTGMQQQVPGENPVQKIMQQLQSLLQNGPGGPQFQSMNMPTFDPNRYKKQAETAVNSEFDPIIQGIMAQQKQTQGRAATNKTAVAGMYGEAVNQINAGAAQTQKGYDQSEATSAGLYKDERNRIAASYAADAAAQRAQAKKLGIEALGGGTEAAIQAQTADKNFADQLGSQQMQSSQAAYGQQEQAAANYDKSIGQATQSEGNEQQADIMRQLESYMGQSNQDITGTRSQAAGATNDLMMQLANAAYQRDSQNAQFQYQQQRDYIGDENNLYDRQRQTLMDQLQMAQNAQGPAGSDKLNPYQDAATFADQLQPGNGSDIIAGIQAAMNGRPEIYARATNDPVNMNPALFAKLIADYPGNEQLDRNSLMMVSQMLYNQLYGK